MVCSHNAALLSQGPFTTFILLQQIPTKFAALSTTINTLPSLPSSLMASSSKIPQTLFSFVLLVSFALVAESRVSREDLGLGLGLGIGLGVGLGGISGSGSGSVSGSGSFSGGGSGARSYAGSGAGGGGGGFGYGYGEGSGGGSGGGNGK